MDTGGLGSADTDAVGNEFGWRAHAAVQSWTAGVDAKASIVLVVETAVAAAGTTGLVSSGGDLHDATGLHLAVAIAAVTFLIFAAASALWVVFPRLNYRNLGRPGLIYFGQLAQHSPEQIAEALAGLSEADERAELAQQLAVTSEIAWRKHVWLQRSIALLALGGILLLCGLLAF